MTKFPMTQFPVVVSVCPSDRKGIPVEDLVLFGWHRDEAGEEGTSAWVAEEWM